MTDERHWAMRASQGRPVCGVEVRIVDDAGNPMPKDGEAVGELEVRGPGITGSYYQGRDAEKFDSCWLRTGDVGTIDDVGYVTLTDRAKDVIKSGGEWISSVELENTSSRTPRCWKPRWSECPLAVVVLHSDATASPMELREFLAGKVVHWWPPER